MSNKQDHFDLIDGRAANSEERTQVMSKPGQSGQGGVGQLEQPAKKEMVKLNLLILVADGGAFKKSRGKQMIGT